MFRIHPIDEDYLPLGLIGWNLNTWIIKKNIHALQLFGWWCVKTVSRLSTSN